MRRVISRRVRLSLIAYSSTSQKKWFQIPCIINWCFYPLQAAKYEIQKTSNCHATLLRCKFWSMFLVFHLAWSTWPATKTFVAGWRNAARWLVDLPGHEQICCATSCESDEKRATKPKFVAQSRPTLYFSQQLSSTRSKCFCCATSWSHKVKNGKHRRKLATKQCCTTSWEFLYLVFRRLKGNIIWTCSGGPVTSLSVAFISFAKK